MNTKRPYYILPVAAAMAFAVTAGARENGASGNRQGYSGNRGNSSQQLAASCTPATAQTDLDVNNVRTTILGGGDMWWDLSNAKYEVPKGGRAHSSFAASLWIGGLDAGGQLKVAAMTYRQTGNDFWPGPLDTTSASIEADQCVAYDRHWKITRKEVEDYAAWYADPSSFPGYTVPLTIQNWPGNGDQSLGQGRFLAPFTDINQNGVYEWAAGEYPGYDLTNSLGCTKFQLYGDQTLWWVFNDKGNVHSETGANPIGLEIHAQAFAFATNDEINNMTFYAYKVINRSSITLNNTYFGKWVDSDLGLFNDDYVGCDVVRGLGYTYNGTQNDGGSPQPSVGTYGANPPAFGMDFFEGPVADAFDGVDNDRDGVTDEAGEQIIMSKFIYYNNDFSITGNPENGTHIYNYLTGFWKDGTPVTYGGNGYGGSQPYNFMFPGDTDPNNSTVWSEISENNTPADRRFLQSAGPFTLQPGAVNYVTVGAVWARAGSGGPAASVELLRVTDDKAQSLFNACFRTLDGPDAPDMDFQELDREVVLYLSNKPTSNNYLESYEAADPSITYSALVGSPLDTTFNFEGYQIFQLKDQSVTTADLYNLDRARLVAQCDVRNGVTQLVNLNRNEALNADVPQDMTILAEDKGINKSFSLTEDAFASGDRRMVNHKTYYFMAISYAYNRYLTYDDVTYDPFNPLSPSNIGQKKPYLAGRKNVKVYSVIPHIPQPELGGTGLNSSYGSGPKITRIEGCGNGNNVIELTQASIDAIMAQTTVDQGGTSRVNEITYENGQGPINVKVIDPLNVPEGDYQVKFINNPYSSYSVASTANWQLIDVTNTASPTIIATSDRAINLVSVFANEQLLPDLGLSITISQVQDPGSQNNPDNNGFLESSITFSESTRRWLTGIVDTDAQNASNWIRAGSNAGPAGNCQAQLDDEKAANVWIDQDAVYEGVVDGTWAPYRLTATNPTPTATTICYDAGPAFPTTASNLTQTRMSFLSNVDVVLTNDRSKWTRVPVLEVGPVRQLNLGQREHFTLRTSPSVDQWGRKAGDPGYDNTTGDLTGTTGMSWFPGYAINIETGERLNMAFGENTALGGENGRDMLWNPTANTTSTFNDLLWGGFHHIYVFGHNGNRVYTGNSDPNLNGQLSDIPAYDRGVTMRRILSSTNASTERAEIFKDAMWVSIPVLADDYSTYTFNYTGSPLPCDVKIRLRVAKPYRRFYTGLNTVSSNVIANTDSAGGLNSGQPPAQNANNPMYFFTTRDLKTSKADNEVAKNALDLINVVPNPYYAYSGYEKNQLDNRIKFTNLPDKCTIRIYTVNGTLIRTFTKDSPVTSLDWDLKNQANIPVASGLYIIHVEVPGVGEKILKWFGVMRPLDLDAY
jgi:hypothetical protein